MKRFIYIVILLAWCSLQVAVADSESPKDTNSSLVLSSDDDNKIHFKQQDYITPSLILRLVLGIFFAVVAVLVVVFVLRKYNFGIEKGVLSNDRNIKLLEVKRLTPKTVLFYVSVKDVHYLLAQSGDNLIVVDKSMDDGSGK